MAAERAQKNQSTEIVVIGAGHAGCEAALAGARMGKRVLLLTMDLSSVAMMPCNPSIGGTGKGHLVREIDALGGQMGLTIDKTMIQMRMLNTAKGPAVHSLRAQADKKAYQEEMRRTLEQTDNLTLKEAEVAALIIENNRAEGVRLSDGQEVRAESVILCTGTFLAGKVFRGSQVKQSGPNGLSPSLALAEQLRQIGLPMRRFKTGTPARARKDSLDYSKMERQDGDPVITPFSFMNDTLTVDQVPCWLTYTNEETHQIIRRNFHRSALFGGQIEGIGPRYCPSIEDKVRRFADKKRHQLFVEPEGRDVEEMYLQGMSTSMPEDVQEEFYRSIPGLENMEILRPGYAIEYDCIDPQALDINLESRQIENLFCAGQFNGSSGYEEAAAQGIMAGINAVCKMEGKPAFVLERSQAYIGVLIDDLIFKGTEEPYRIMTSRAEYRLLLRNDNADLRLTELSYRAGLATEARYQRMKEKERRVKEEVERLRSTEVTPAQAEEFLRAVGTSPLKQKTTLAELLRRPEVTYENMKCIDDEARPSLASHEALNVQVQLKYQGYMEKQQAQIEKFQRLEHRTLPADLDYHQVHGLRLEARQKLSKQRPRSLGQASRISGVSPADINVLLIYLERQRREEKQ